MKLLKILPILVAFSLLLMLPLGADESSAATFGDYTYELDGGNANITGYTGSDVNLVIPSLMDTYPVTKINTSAFASGTFTSVTIPDGVITILDSAFASCTNLQTVIMPDSVTTLGDNVFNGDTSLSVCNLSENLTTMGDGTFSGCTALAGMTIPDSVTSMGTDTFNGCVALLNTTLGSGLTSLPNRTYQDCSVMTVCWIPSGITVIGDDVFDGCVGLVDIYFLGDQPTTGTNWINNTDAEIEGHAYSTSDFPVPGEEFDGLLMGDTIDYVPPDMSAIMVLLTLFVVMDIAILSGIKNELAIQVGGAALAISLITMGLLTLI